MIINILIGQIIFIIIFTIITIRIICRKEIRDKKDKKRKDRIIQRIKNNYFQDK